MAPQLWVVSFDLSHDFYVLEIYHNAVRPTTVGMAHHLIHGRVMEINDIWYIQKIIQVHVRLGIIKLNNEPIE